MEQSLVIIKPDGLSKKTAGKIIAFLEKENFKMVACRMFFLDKEKAELFYKEHWGKDFYLPLVSFMSSNPSLVMIWQGDEIISGLRKIVGNTNPDMAEEGTIRKMYARDNRHNVVHCSDSTKSAQREINFFFPEEEIYNWERKEYKK
jgi:nucleoside-diphosphate kinase